MKVWYQSPGVILNVPSPNIWFALARILRWTLLSSDHQTILDLPSQCSPPLCTKISEDSRQCPSSTLDLVEWPVFWLIVEQFSCLGTSGTLEERVIWWLSPCLLYTADGQLHRFLLDISFLWSCLHSLHGNLEFWFQKVFTSSFIRLHPSAAIRRYTCHN